MYAAGNIEVKKVNHAILLFSSWQMMTAKPLTVMVTVVMVVTTVTESNGG
jgi:hypothetical protein